MTSIEDEEEIITQCWFKKLGIDPEKDLIPPGFEKPSEELAKFHSLLEENGFNPLNHTLYTWYIHYGPLHGESGYAFFEGQTLIKKIKVWTS